MIHRRKFKAQCRCGEVLTFHQGPRGFKKVCPRCKAVIRLKPPPLLSDSGTVLKVPDSKIIISCPCGEMFATTFQNLGRRVSCPECGKAHHVRVPGRDTTPFPAHSPSDTDEIEPVKK